jgi:hypothetical protein
VWYKDVKGKESRLVISKRVCRCYKVLIFDLVKKVGSVSPSLFIKYNHYARIIPLSLCLPTVVPVRLPFKHKEGLATEYAICEYTNLKCTLAFVVFAFAFLDANCLVSPFGICTAFEVLE